MAYTHVSWPRRLCMAAGLAVGMACCQHGFLSPMCDGQEPIPSSSEPGLFCKIQTYCGRMMARQPYRPFDNHYPRFHPVPTSPVFPSLYDVAVASGAAPLPANRSPGETGPLVAPKNEASPPAPLPELIPTPPAKPGQSTAPRTPSPQRQASRSNPAASWIFLPASDPSVKEEGHSGHARQVASESGPIVR